MAGYHGFMSLRLGSGGLNRVTTSRSSSSIGCVPKTRPLEGPHRFRRRSSLVCRHLFLAVSQCHGVGADFIQFSRPSAMGQKVWILFRGINKMIPFPLGGFCGLDSRTYTARGFGGNPFPFRLGHARRARLGLSRIFENGVFPSKPSLSQ